MHRPRSTIGSALVSVTTLTAMASSTYASLTFTNYTAADGLLDDDVQWVHVDGSTIYVGTNGGLSTSSNGGATWTGYTTTD
jgi:hypothetical protein